jgi:uncharacterized RDD family membrane protein YckC
MRLLPFHEEHSYVNTYRRVTFKKIINKGNHPMEKTYSTNEVTTPLPTNNLAGRGKRLAAYIIDSVAFILIVMLSVIPGGMIDGADDSTVMLIIVLSGFVIYLVFQGYLLTTTGQSLGKRFLGIKIVKHKTGENGGFVTNVLVRFGVNYILASFIPFYGLIDVLFIFSIDKECIHDKMAGTKVVNVGS